MRWDVSRKRDGNVSFERQKRAIEMLGGSVLEATYLYTRQIQSSRIQVFGDAG